MSEERLLKTIEQMNLALPRGLCQACVLAPAPILQGSLEVILGSFLSFIPISN